MASCPQSRSTRGTRAPPVDEESDAGLCPALTQPRVIFPSGTLERVPQEVLLRRTESFHESRLNPPSLASFGVVSVERNGHRDSSADSLTFWSQTRPRLPEASLNY